MRDKRALAVGCILCLTLFVAAVYCYPVWRRHVTYVEEDWWFALGNRTSLRGTPEKLREQIQDDIERTINQTTLRMGKLGQVRVLRLDLGTSVVDDFETGESTLQKDHYRCFVHVRCDPEVAIRVGRKLEELHRRWGSFYSPADLQKVKSPSVPAENSVRP